MPSYKSRCLNFDRNQHKLYNLSANVRRHSEDYAPALAHPRPYAISTEFSRVVTSKTAIFLLWCTSDFHRASRAKYFSVKLCFIFLSCVLGAQKNRLGNAVAQCRSAGLETEGSSLTDITALCH